jgi:hypothetical protein
MEWNVTGTIERQSRTEASYRQVTLGLKTQPAHTRLMTEAATVVHFEEM